MAQLFVSHIHEEVRVAQAVLGFLNHHGLAAFLSSDHWQIRAGERWFDRIVTELTDAKVVILLLSGRSVARPWISFEAGWAWGTSKVIIPLCFGGLTKGAMPRPYSDLQGLDLRTDYYDLVKDCYLHMGTLPPPPIFSDDKEVKELIRQLDSFEQSSGS